MESQGTLNHMTGPKQVKAGQNDALQLRSLSDPTEKNKGLEILEQ